MKFDEKGKVFSPVTIVLETIQEVNLFAAWAGNTSARAYRAFGLDEDDAEAFYNFINRRAEADHLEFKDIDVS